MKGINILILFLVLLFSITAIVAEEPFTPEGQMFAPAPEGHAVGKDNEPGFETKALHFPGEDCGVCHTPGGPAERFVFTISGTIFKDKAGRQPLEGAEVILKDADGNVISMTTNSAGNFYSYAPIAFTPVEDDDPENPRNWRYKAWVKYGDTVRPMIYICYVGSKRRPRMSCNMHHSSIGSRGAVSAGKFPTLPEFPEENISFKKHIMPILKNRCKACHLPASENPVRAYYPDETDPLDYSGGLDLSSYYKDPASKKGITDVVNTANPDASLILIKTIPGAQHAGGAFWEPTDIEYRVIRQWIAEGAQNN